MLAEVKYHLKLHIYESDLSVLPLWSSPQTYEFDASDRLEGPFFWNEGLIHEIDFELSRTEKDLYSCISAFEFRLPLLLSMNSQNLLRRS